jgi:hypothetical protein
MIDLLLYISGMSGQGGQELEPNNPAKDDDVINEFAKIQGDNQIVIKGWGGTSDSGLIIRKAAEVIRQFHPFNRLIIYGYSAGGVNAMELCRALSQTPKMRIKVDLLVTVDAAMGELSGGLSRFIPSNVDVCMNCWTAETTTFGDSHGGPAAAMVDGTTRIKNFHFSDKNHDTIRLAAQPNVVWEITKCVRNLIGYKKT